MRSGLLSSWKPGGSYWFVEAHVKAGSDHGGILFGGAMERWGSELERAMKVMGW